MENEIWKDIKDYEGFYKISNKGRIKSLYNYKRNGTSFLQPQLKRGYFQIGLRKDKKRKWFSVHRLVAEAFIPNIYNFPCVNHKDENKLNNNADNLEWCSHAYNNTYGTRIKKVKEKTGKKVLQYDKDMNFIKEYSSIAEATREMKLKSMCSICNCCKGVYKTSKGYIWKYKKEVV